MTRRRSSRLFSSPVFASQYHWKVWQVWPAASVISSTVSSHIQGVSPHWGVMLTQAPIWGNREWETKFLFHAPVSLDWCTFRLTPLCIFPNFPRLWLRVGVALFPQIGVVLRRKVRNLDVYSHLFHPIGACFPRLEWSSQKTTFSELAMCKTTDNFI